jgi:hypothetical protein
MPVAQGKVETKLHLPKRAFDYIKRHAGARGMGQFVMDMVLCHEKQGAMADRIVSIDDQLAELVEYVKGQHVNMSCEHSDADDGL